MVHEDMDLVTELDGEDITVQFHVSRHRRVVHMVPQMVRYLGGFLSDLLGIVGNAVENAGVAAVIEQAPDLVDVMVPMGKELGTKCTMFFNQKRDPVNLLEARPLAEMNPAKALMIMQGPLLGNRFGRSCEHGLHLGLDLLKFLGYIDGLSANLGYGLMRRRDPWLLRFALHL